MAELTEKLSEWVTKASFKDLPQGVVRTAKNAIIDCVGVTIPGCREEASLIIQQYARQMDGNPQASVIGAELKTTGTLAALANGVAAHVLDLDDVNSLLIGHPSVVLMPTVFAAGELAEATGESILLGYVVGFEVMVKLAGVLNPEHYEHGWHATSTFGALGAAAAAAKILSLSLGQTSSALGLATSLAGGVRLNFGTMTKAFHAGNAARAGLESAILCQKGFTAHKKILDQPMGFLNVFGSGEQSEKVRNKVADSLGNPYELTSSGIDIKRYPCCGGVLAAVDAAIAIRNKPGFSLNDIEAIECGQNSLGPQILIYSNPQNGLEAKFSIEYGVCRALIDGRLGLEELSDGKVREPVVQDLLRKTRAFVHPELEKVKLSEEDRAQRFPAIVTVKLKGGNVLGERVDNAKGRWDNPLTQEELFEKYRLYAGAYLERDRVEKSLDLMDSLEDIENISELILQLT